MFDHQLAQKKQHLVGACYETFQPSLVSISSVFLEKKIQNIKSLQIADTK